MRETCWKSPEAPTGYGERGGVRSRLRAGGKGREKVHGVIPSRLQSPPLTRRDIVIPKDQLLGNPPAERDGHLVLEVRAAVQPALQPLLGRCEEGEAAGGAARHDGDLGHGVVLGHKAADEGVASLVVGDLRRGRGQEGSGRAGWGGGRAGREAGSGRPRAMHGMHSMECIRLFFSALLTSLRFFSLTTAPFFSGPATMRSSASAISSLLISLRLRRAARMAASFIRF